MTTAPATTLTDPSLHRALEQVVRQLAGLGFVMTVYDPAGRPLITGLGDAEVCHRLCARGAGESPGLAQGLKQVWSDGQPRVLAGPAGCVVLGLPVIHRRRPVALARVCYLPSDLGEREALARSCDRLQLDRAYMVAALRRTTCHPASEAPYWMEVIQLLLDQVLGNAVARNELASFSNSLGSTYEELSLLYRLSGAMKVSARPTAFFAQVCGELLDVMDVRAAAVVLSDPALAQRWGPVIRAGKLNLTDERLTALARRLLADREGVPGEPGLVVNHPCPDLSRQFPAVANVLAVPLQAGQHPMGLLLAINKTDGEFDSPALKLMHSVAGPVAVFLANNHLYDELQDLLMGVLHVLTASIDAKDQYTCGHSQRVALISRRLGELCGFDNAGIENVYLSGLLHDIGKIGIPETVLCKPGKLSDAEFVTMKRHPVIGANILANIRQMKPVLPGVLHHHERLDGRGYPQGLRHHEIPLEGRIVGLADCFDAMTSSRTYREALPLPFVVSEIIRCSGTQFDPQLVDHLLTLDLPAFMAELRQAKPMVSAISGMIRGGAA